MIKKIPNLPENVLGFTASGEVTAEDYERVMIPAVDELFDREGTVRFVYHLGKDFTGFEAGAMWDDAKLGFKHLTGWEKVAVVSDVEWIRGAMQIFGFVIPGHVKIFHNSELTEATQWLSEA